MGTLIDERGRLLPPRHLVARLENLPHATDRLVAAIRWFGFVYIKPVGRSVLIAFRPELVSNAALAGAFRAIQLCVPDRILLSYRTPQHPPEIYSDANSALKRIEQLSQTRRLPAFRSGIVADRRPLGEVAKLAEGRAGEFLRGWTASSHRWSTSLRRELRATGLLAQTMIVRVPATADSFLVEHWGSRKRLLGRDWTREARGRDIREQPYPALTEWVVEAFRSSLTEREPRLDDVRATIVTPQGDVRRRGYQRLLVPFAAANGETLATVTNFFL